MKGKSIPYSDIELDWLRENCTLVAKEYHAQFVSKFGRDDVSVDNVVSVRKRNGWKTGRTGKFEKGNIPSPNARPKGPNSSSFKKGNIPKNILPVGTTVITTDGYPAVKLAQPNKWGFVHIMNWEKHNGPIPDGMCVTFIDDDQTNTDIENLELISRAELLRTNQLKGRLHPTPDAMPAVKAIAKLQTKAANLTVNKPDPQ